MKNKEMSMQIRKKRRITFALMIFIIAFLGVGILFRDTSMEVKQISSNLDLVNLQLYDNVKDSVEAANVQTEKELRSSFFHLSVECKCEVKIFVYMLDLEAWREIKVEKVEENGYTFMPMSVTTEVDEPETIIYRIDITEKYKKTKMKYFAFECEE